MLNVGTEETKWIWSANQIITGIICKNNNRNKNKKNNNKIK